MISAVGVTTAELDALGRTGEREPVLDIICGGTKICLVVNVPSAEIPRTGWAEGEVQLELTHSQAKRVGGQLQKTADVYKFQVTVTQTTVRTPSLRIRWTIPAKSGNWWGFGTQVLYCVSHGESMTIASTGIA